MWDNAGLADGLEKATYGDENGARDSSHNMAVLPLPSGLRPRIGVRDRLFAEVMKWVAGVYFHSSSYHESPDPVRSRGWRQATRRNLDGASLYASGRGSETFLLD